MTGRFGRGEHAGRPNDAQDLDAVEHRHVPIEQHHVGIGGANDLQRREPVRSLEHRFRAEVGEHHTREPAHMGIVIDDQDGETLEHLFDLLVGHEPAGPVRQYRRQFRSKFLFFG
ncbi:MAG TPA: hypothetical protein VI137_01880 [Pseudolabrys sp.]